MKTMHCYGFLAVISILLSVSGAVAAADDKFEIIHNKISHASIGDRINISATVNDPHRNVETVRAYFKTALDDRFYFVVMEKHPDNTYSGLLPAPLPGSESLEYIILGKSTSDQIIKTRRFVVEVEDKRAIARLD